MQHEEVSVGMFSCPDRLAHQQVLFFLMVLGTKGDSNV